MRGVTGSAFMLALAKPKPFFSKLKYAMKMLEYVAASTPNEEIIFRKKYKYKSS